MKPDTIDSAAQRQAWERLWERLLSVPAEQGPEPWEYGEPVSAAAHALARSDQESEP